MVPATHEQALVDFFKALGEPHRLRIVGLLAQRPHSVEQLAAALGLGVSTVSHHLTRLARAGLVSARSESYYNLYALETTALSELAKKLLAQAEAARPVLEQTLAPYDRKVLATFTSPDGRITAFPTQEKKMRVLVRHVLPSFSHGVRYSEKRVNEILAKFSDDTARLRRWLVELGYMSREGGGGKYWRIDAE
jgi:DNA-binding transcriptional ArsR family regulator